MAKQRRDDGDGRSMLEDACRVLLRDHALGTSDLDDAEACAVDLLVVLAVYLTNGTWGGAIGGEVFARDKKTAEVIRRMHRVLRGGKPHTAAGAQRDELTARVKFHAERARGEVKHAESKRAGEHFARWLGERYPRRARVDEAALQSRLARCVEPRKQGRLSKGAETPDTIVAWLADVGAVPAALRRRKKSAS